MITEKSSSHIRAFLYGDVMHGSALFPQCTGSGQKAYFAMHL